MIGIAQPLGSSGTIIQESVMITKNDLSKNHAQLSSAVSHRHKTMLLAAAAFVSCNLATQGFAQEKAPNAPKDNILASLSLKDGSIVQFNETSPGEIVVSALTPMGVGRTESAAAINGVSIKSLQRLDAVGKFKALAGGAAVPAGLVQAQARVNAAMRRGLAQESIGKAATRAPAMRGGATELDGGTFQSTYCPSSGYTFNFCWLYRTGSGYVQRSASYLQSTINAYQGNVGHKLQYQSCVLWSCSWYTNVSWTVLHGYTQWITVSGSRKTRKASSYEADGDGYHWAIFGY
jgi:hypothetical protein